MKPRCMKAIFIATVFLLVSGCSTYKSAMKLYDEAPLCCKSVREFSYEKIGLNSAKEFTLDEDSPAFLFDSGKSFFKAFSLPPYSVPYRIGIHSYIQGQYFDYAHIFVPRVVFLNERYEIVRSTDPSLFHFKKAALSETRGLRFKVEGYVDVTEKNGNEKFFIVMTTDEILKGKTLVSRTKTIPIVIMPGSVLPLPLGEEKVAIPNSPFGKIKIELGRM